MIKGKYQNNRIYNNRLTITKIINHYNDKITDSSVKLKINNFCPLSIKNKSSYQQSFGLIHNNKAINSSNIQSIIVQNQNISSFNKLPSISKIQSQYRNSFVQKNISAQKSRSPISSNFLNLGYIPQSLSQYQIQFQQKLKHLASSNIQPQILKQNSLIQQGKYKCRKSTYQNEYERLKSLSTNIQVYKQQSIVLKQNVDKGKKGIIKQQKILGQHFKRRKTSLKILENAKGCLQLQNALR